MFLGSKEVSAFRASMAWDCTPAVEIGEGGTGRLLSEMALLAVNPLPEGQPVDAATAVGDGVVFA
jgi:hypothetical protein